MYIAVCNFCGHPAGKAKIHVPSPDMDALPTRDIKGDLCDVCASDVGKAVAMIRDAKQAKLRTTVVAVGKQAVAGAIAEEKAATRRVMAYTRRKRGGVSGWRWKEVPVEAGGGLGGTMATQASRVGSGGRDPFDGADNLESLRGVLPADVQARLAWLSPKFRKAVHGY